MSDTDRVTYVSIPAQENMNSVHAIVNKISNPNPVVIMTICITVFVIIYAIYVIFIKINFGGKWVIGGRSVEIIHNKWFDTIHLDIPADHIKPSNTTINGWVSGNAIFLQTDAREPIKGILFDDTITWNDRSTWIRPKTVV